jgi:hypothetical protein
LILGEVNFDKTKSLKKIRGRVGEKIGLEKINKGGWYGF